MLLIVTTGGPPVQKTPGRCHPTSTRRQYLPYDKLFPQLGGMVTNGGYGGVHYALAHWVPLVVAGGGEDKPEVAARIAWSGTGVNLRTGRPKPEAIRHAVREVLDNTRYRTPPTQPQQIASAPRSDGLANLMTNLAQHH